MIPRAHFARRRWRNFSVLGLALIVLLVWFAQRQSDLAQYSFSTGYCLLGALVFLAAYNVRKRFPSIAWLGTSSQWMQVHIYVALGSLAVFIAHVGWENPQGVLERILGGLYLTVFGSGLLGLYWTRSIPRRLSAVRDQIVFEQIPLRRSDLIRQVRQLLFEAHPASSVLCRFYVNHLAPFFERPRPILYLIKPSGTKCRALVDEIDGLSRYLAPAQRETGKRLAELVRSKDDLDFHLALQGRLRIWLFLHIGLTYSLLLIAVVHGLTAHRFHGGLP